MEQEVNSEFCFSNVELFKSETIGSGAYGAVCKARCDKLDCAAKLLFNTLLDLREDDELGGSGGSQSHRTPLNRFKQECQFLSQVNHPNIVQYLGTFCDPNANPKVIVLLMELMNESLTHFLDKSPGTVPLHMQVNIGYDVILALTYLHRNSIIHRDLSSNNVLLTASKRAKVSDFGMSTILGNTGMSNSLTVCPGNVIYMPPEALDDSPVYSNSLDIFSFGVLLVQIYSRLFPSPSNRFTTVDIISPVSHKAVEAKLSVPEVERRKIHIQMIPGSNPLLPTIKECLKDSESERPLADQLCNQFEAIKRSQDYLTSQEDAASNCDVVLSENIYELDDELPARAQQYVDKIRQLEDENEQLREREEEKEQELASNYQLLSIRAHELQRVTKMLKAKQEEGTTKDPNLMAELDALRNAHCDSSAQMQHLNGTIDDMTRETTRLREQIKLQDSTVADLQAIVDDREDYISSTKAHLLAEMEDNQNLRAQLDGRATLVSNTSIDSIEHECLDMWIPTKVTEMERNMKKKDMEVESLKKFIAIKDANIKSLEELLQTTEAKLKETSSRLKPPITPRSPSSPRSYRSLESVLSSATLTLPPVRQMSSPGTSPELVSRPRPGQGDGSVQIAWDTGVSTPCPIQAGSTAVFDGKVYCRPANKGEIFELCTATMKWRQLGKCPSSACTLVNINNVLTTVGGRDTKKLWSYVKIGGGGGTWTEIYPQMRVERYNAAAAYSNNTLVVAGGFLRRWNCISDVEVLDVTSHIWFTTQPLPYSIYSASVAVCNDRVYVVGGYFEKARGHFSVLSCPLANLTERSGSQGTWKKTADLPVCRSTCVNFRGRLAVFGGRMVNGCDSKAVYLYHSSKNAWVPVSAMSIPRSECHVAVLNNSKVVVAGGCVGSEMTLVDSVEIGDIIVGP